MAGRENSLATEKNLASPLSGGIRKRPVFFPVRFPLRSCVVDTQPLLEFREWPSRRACFRGQRCSLFWTIVVFFSVVELLDRPRPSGRLADCSAILMDCRPVCTRRTVLTTEY